MPTKTIPILETKRLVLRGPEPEDYPNFKATFAPYHSHFIVSLQNAHETWILYAAKIGHWNSRGYRMSVVHDQGTDDPLGRAGS